MSTYARYLIAGPMASAADARAAATAWEGGDANTMYQHANLYLLNGGSPTVATHTCSFGLINVDYVPAIQAAIGARFPGWQIVQHDDPNAALAQAGLGRVTPTMP